MGRISAQDLTYIAVRLREVDQRIRMMSELNEKGEQEQVPILEPDPLREIISATSSEEDSGETGHRPHRDEEGDINDYGDDPTA